MFQIKTLLFNIVILCFSVSGFALELEPKSIHMDDPARLEKEWLNTTFDAFEHCIINRCMAQEIQSRYESLLDASRDLSEATGGMLDYTKMIIKARQQMHPGPKIIAAIKKARESDTFFSGNLGGFEDDNLSVIKEFKAASNGF